MVPNVVRRAKRETLRATRWGARGKRENLPNDLILLLFHLLNPPFHVKRLLGFIVMLAT